MMLSLAACASELLICPHHPDLSRRPQPRPGLIAEDLACASLAWNVFRTLALIAPPFWLRRFRARLVQPPVVDRVPQHLDIRLWPRLEPPPGAPAGDESGGLAVWVETDVAVYGIATFYRSDMSVRDALSIDPVLRLADMVSWHAGVRDCYVAVITSAPGYSPVVDALVDRYRSSRAALATRLPHRHDGLTNVRGIGRVTWHDMASILRDCRDAAVLDELERFAARRVVRWLEAQGIHPAD